MTIATSSAKPVLLLRSLMVALCCGWLSPANAELESTGQSVLAADLLPDDISSGIGKWRDRENWRDLGASETVSAPEIATLPPLKTSAWPWWDVVDTAAYIATSIGIAKPAGRYSRPYQLSPPVNSPVPPK